LNTNTLNIILLDIVAQKYYKTSKKQDKALPIMSFKISNVCT